MAKNKKKKILINLGVILLLIGIFTIFTLKFIGKDNKAKEQIPNNSNIDEKKDKQEEGTEEDKNNEDNENNDEESKNDNSSTEEPDNKPSASNENNNTNNSSNKPSSNENHHKPSNENTNNNSNNNPNTSEKPDTKPEEKPEEKPVTPPKEDKNDTKRKSIEKTYGIKILYGNEIGSYKPKGITPTLLTDESEIEDFLNRLNTELAKYPKNFFQDFNKQGMPLTIYLIKSVNGAFSGFTDYQFMNNIKMTLATDYNFEYTIHHEIMHYIDCYLNIVMYPKTPYEEYEAFNPTDFIYGNATSSQIYNMGTNPRGAYFISQYGSTHVAEDRAEVFKFMTARAYAPIGCFEKNEVIRKKAEVISKQIKTYFPSVTGAAHWDRFIKE